MLKNITFSVEEDLIQKARDRALAEKTTLNAVFRRWLRQYSERKKAAEEYDEIMESLSYARVGKKFSREEMNER